MPQFFILWGDKELRHAYGGGALWRLSLVQVRDWDETRDQGALLPKGDRMIQKLGGWVLLAIVTFLNIRIFVARWTEEPRAPFGALISDIELTSIAVGVCSFVLLIAVLDMLRSFRFCALVVLLTTSALVLLLMPSMLAVKFLINPVMSFIGLGAALSLLCFQLRDSAPDIENLHLGRSFVLMAIASFNVFLLMAPWTTHVPSYVQDSVTGVPMLSTFYYGSIHSNVSPVSVGVRRVINFFFERPSINATAMSSMIYLSVALALSGAALEMAFGRLWGWAVLFLAWTDRWLFASAISSAIIGQPVLSTAYAIFLCTWALWRKPAPL